MRILISGNVFVSFSFFAKLFCNYGLVTQDKKNFLFLKFIYSEKATTISEISNVEFSYIVPVKSRVEILKNFEGFSEYMNFNNEVFRLETKEGELILNVSQEDLEDIFLMVFYQKRWILLKRLGCL